MVLAVCVLSQDYETLELPVGASRAEVKKAYRKLALLVSHGYTHTYTHTSSRTFMLLDLATFLTVWGCADVSLCALSLTSLSLTVC